MADDVQNSTVVGIENCFSMENYCRKRTSANLID